MTPNGSIRHAVAGAVRGHTDQSGKADVALFGGAVKALPGGKVGGYLVRFSTADDPDLQGDFFTKDTDFGPHAKSIVFYHHGMDKTLGPRVLDEDASMKADDVGVWCEAQLDLRDKYAKAVYKLAKDGKLGWSSGTAQHLMQREAVKNTKGGTANWVKFWPLGLDASLTPTPVEPRTEAAAIKSLAVPDFEALMESSIKSTGFSADDRREMIQGALNVKMGRSSTSADGYRWFSWVRDIFDTSFVFVRDDGDGDTDYFEAPYSITGNEVTIGDPVPVVRQTTYIPVEQTDDGMIPAVKSISAALEACKDLRFGDHSDSVRTAVKGYAERVRNYATLRADKGRELAPDRVDDFRSMREDLAAALKALDETLARATANEIPIDVERIRLEAAANDVSFWAR